MTLLVRRSAETRSSTSRVSRSRFCLSARRTALCADCCLPRPSTDLDRAPTNPDLLPLRDRMAPFCAGANADAFLLYLYDFAQGSGRWAFKLSWDAG